LLKISLFQFANNPKQNPFLPEKPFKDAFNRNIAVDTDDPLQIIEVDGNNREIEDKKIYIFDKVY
jgi:hypothetical protein